MKNVIIFGHMYSGKSTIASILANNGYARISFSSALKNIASIAYGPIDKGGTYLTTDSDRTASLISGRELLQSLGQKVKEIDEDFWLKCAMRSINAHLDHPVVIDDGRFMFEFEQMRNLGWVTVGISTSLDTRMERANTLLGRYPKDTELFHESEMELDKIMFEADIVISGENGSDPLEEAYKVIEFANQSR